MSLYEEEGCCLTCPEKGPGCLCFECRCSQCSAYNPGDNCDVTKDFQIQIYSEMQSNLEVNYRQNNWLEVKTIGPVDRKSYAEIKPFLKLHFQYNFDKKCYETYTTNPRFLNLLRKVLREAEFYPNFKGRLAP